MMKNTKTIPVIIAVLLSFSSCAADENPHLEASLLQGNPSGTWFALSNAISEAVNNSYPQSLINITPGDVVPNVIRLGNVEADFALTHSYVAGAALKGEFPFETPIDNIGSVASFYPSSAQLFLLKDLGVSTFREVIDNRVAIDISIGKKGELVEESFYQLLKEYGVTKEEMEGWGCTFANAGHSDGGLLFADGVTDGYYVMVSSPSPVVMENSISKELVLVEFGPDVVASMCDKYGYSAQTIAAGVYPFMDKDVQVFANYTILLASLETAEEPVYMMTKSLYENMEYLKLSHAALQDMTSESMLQNLGIPLHPGAEKYYKEAGLL